MDIPHIACNAGDRSALDLVTMIEDSLAPTATRLLDEAEQSRLVADIEAALPRVHRYAPATPILRVPSLDSLISGQVLLKAECVQATGSFKIRGALNVMTQLCSKGVDRVIAFSSGNHGIGVAYAARCLGMSAQIVVPDDAPSAKIDHIRRLGGELVWYDRMSEDREQVANALQHENPAPLVKPTIIGTPSPVRAPVGPKSSGRSKHRSMPRSFALGAAGYLPGPAPISNHTALTRASSPRNPRVGTIINCLFNVDSVWRRLATAQGGATASSHPSPGNSPFLLIRPTAPRVFTRLECGWPKP